MPTRVDDHRPLVEPHAILAEREQPTLTQSRKRREGHQLGLGAPGRLAFDLMPSEVSRLGWTYRTDLCILDLLLLLQPVKHRGRIGVQSMQEA